MSRYSILLTSLMLSFLAHAEIENPLILPLGDRESLMGNSGVSVAGSAGNIFYNPAGLYSLTGRKFSGTGSSYAYIKGKTEAFDDGIDFDTIASVPNMIALTRRIRSWTYGFGIFSPIAFENSISFETVSTGLGLRLKLTNDSRTEEQYIGFASGKDIGRGWAFGLGLFVHRYVNRTTSSLFAFPDTVNAHLAKVEKTELETLGLLPIIGLQAQVTEKLRFGLRIAPPDIQLLGRSKLKSDQMIESGGSVAVERVDKEQHGHYRLPTDTSVGLSWTPNKKHFATLDLGTQFRTRFDSMPGQTKGILYDTRTTFRQNFGYQYHFSDANSILVGLSRSPSTLGNSRDKEGTPLERNTFYALNLGFYSRENIATTGVGLFYITTRTKELFFNLEREKKSGFQVYGLTLTATIEY